MYELKVLVVLFGIGMAVAIPGYDDYLTRRDVEEGLALASPAKRAVEEAFRRNGPADMSSAAVTGWQSPPSTPAVSGITVAPSGVVTVAYTKLVGSADANRIQMVPVSGGRPLDLSREASRGRPLEWQCGGAAGATTVPDKFRPVGCRSKER